MEDRIIDAVVIEGTSIVDSWWRTMNALFDHGYRYEINQGSSTLVGKKRLEFDLVTVLIRQPWIKPIVPGPGDLPEGVPTPASLDFVEDYFLRYLMSSCVADNEVYTYGSFLECQIQQIIDLYKKTKETQGGYETNQACMMVGDKNSLEQGDPPCLRLIDTRIRYGKLHFVVYFRSWDLWGGFPSNVAGIQLLKKYMADEIGVEDGEIMAISKGLHLYDDAWPFAEMVLRRKLER